MMLTKMNLEVTGLLVKREQSEVHRTVYARKVSLPDHDVSKGVYLTPLVLPKKMKLLVVLRRKRLDDT